IHHCCLYRYNAFQHLSSVPGHVICQRICYGNYGATCESMYVFVLVNCTIFYVFPAEIEFISRSQELCSI
uniref:Uncharacterized protein n=2 Tax=Aegilops tauschii subsp. strangulata TaxID=200361 RepID=A0A453I4E2_AEGTS